MAYKIIWESKGLLVKFSGIVTEKEVMMVNDLIYGDKRFETITYQIADYTVADEIHISPRDAQVIGALDKSSARWNPRMVKNIVITKDKNFIPIAEKYFREFEGTQWEGRIFETLEMAYAWINSQESL